MHKNINLPSSISAGENKIETPSTFEKRKTAQTKNITKNLSRGANKHESKIPFD